MDQKCEKCGGTGKITIYRSDIEDFDEIICPECHGRSLILNKDEESVWIPNIIINLTQSYSKIS